MPEALGRLRSLPGCSLGAPVCGWPAPTVGSGLNPESAQLAPVGGRPGRALRERAALSSPYAWNRPAQALQGCSHEPGHLSAQVLALVVVDGQGPDVGVAGEASGGPDVALGEVPCLDPSKFDPAGARLHNAGRSGPRQLSAAGV